MPADTRTRMPGIHPAPFAHSACRTEQLFLISIHREASSLGHRKEMASETGHGRVKGYGGRGQSD